MPCCNITVINVFGDVTFGLALSSDCVLGLTPLRGAIKFTAPLVSVNELNAS